MKTKFLWLVGCAVVWSLAVTAGVAAESKAGAEERAAACAREAKGLKGEQQARAVEECLRQGGNGAPDRELTPQQNKMKACNARARERELRGDERRAFMSACLKG